jgi:hypothetical protein
MSNPEAILRIAPEKSLGGSLPSYDQNQMIEKFYRIRSG